MVLLRAIVSYSAMIEYRYFAKTEITLRGIPGKQCRVETSARNDLFGGKNELRGIPAGDALGPPSVTLWGGQEAVMSLSWRQKAPDSRDYPRLAILARTMF